MKHYLRWQQDEKRVRRGELGKIPTAFEYREYKKWRTARQQEAESFLDVYRFTSQLGEHLRTKTTRDGQQPNVARECNHPLHPAVADAPFTEMCPCCLMQMHLTYMEVLTTALERFEGSWREPGHSEDSDRERILRAWYVGKLQLLQARQHLEQQAFQEDEWGAQHPEIHISDTVGAGPAIQLYWQSVDAQVSDSETTFKNTGKRVSFGEETDFSPGRPQLYFNRRSPRYEPGKYSAFISDEDASDEEDLDNTDQYKFGMDQVDGCTDSSTSDESDQDESGEEDDPDYADQHQFGMEQLDGCVDDSTSDESDDDESDDDESDDDDSEDGESEEDEAEDTECESDEDTEITSPDIDFICFADV
jgi:hypothetical protein